MNGTTKQRSSRQLYIYSRMEIVERFKNNLIQSFDIDLKHAIRLVLIVGGYYFIRQIAQRELAKRQLKSQLEQKDAELHAQHEGELNSANDFALDEESTADTTSFGWGKKTRQRVKKQEKLLEAEFKRLQENAAEIDEEEDKDIEDLLID